MNLSKVSHSELLQALTPQRLNAMRKEFVWSHLQMLGLLALGIFWSMGQSPQSNTNAADALRFLTLMNPLVLVLVLGLFYKNRAKRFSAQRISELQKGTVLNPKGKTVSFSPAELCIEMIGHDLKLECAARLNASALGLLVFAFAAWTSVLISQPIYALNTAPALIFLGQAIRLWPREDLITERCALWIQSQARV